MSNVLPFRKAEPTRIHRNDEWLVFYATNLRPVSGGSAFTFLMTEDGKNLLTEDDQKLLVEP